MQTSPHQKESEKEQKIKGFQHSRIGDSAAVLGAGTIGLFTLISLKLSGASLILVSELNETKRGIAEKFGADLVLNPSEEDSLEVVEAESEIGVDKVFDCVGSPETFNESTEIVRRGGEIFTVGIPEEAVKTFPAVWIPKEIRLKTIFGYNEEFETALDLLASGTVDTDSIISDVISLENIMEDGFRALLEDRKKVKILAPLKSLQKP